jgi:hypothetical protein
LLGEPAHGQEAKQIASWRRLGGAVKNTSVHCMMAKNGWQKPSASSAAPVMVGCARHASTRCMAIRHNTEATYTCPRRSRLTSNMAAGGAARGVSGQAVWGYLSGNGLLRAVGGGWIAAGTVADQLQA